MTHVPQQPSLRAADIMTPRASGIPLQLKSYRGNIRVRQMQTVPGGSNCLLQSNMIKSLILCGYLKTSSGSITKRCIEVQRSIVQEPCIICVFRKMIQVYGNRIFKGVVSCIYSPYPGIEKNWIKKTRSFLHHCESHFFTSDCNGKSKQIFIFI